MGSKVLVFREYGNRWEGPFTLVGMEDETCKVALPAGIAPFRSTAVKPFFEENTGGDNGADTQLESDDDINDKIELDDDDAVINMTEKMERRCFHGGASQ